MKHGSPRLAESIRAHFGSDYKGLAYIGAFRKGWWGAHHGFSIEACPYRYQTVDGPVAFINAWEAGWKAYHKSKEERRT